MTTISANLQAVRERIAATARKCGRRPEEITLLAVSKSWPASALRQAAAAGQQAFGENYMQEGLAKVAELAPLKLDWHFIGPLQSNKTRLVAAAFNWVHAIDRLKIAERLSEQRPSGLPPLQVCLQVNVSGEASKSGLTPHDTALLARQVAALPRLKLRGLMAIPEALCDLAEQRAAFRSLRAIYDGLRIAGLPLDTLSMGMSDDFEAAIAEGSTLVRVGSAIFGERNRL